MSTTDDPIIEREEPNITLSNRGEMQEFSSVEEMFTATGFEVIEPSYIPQSFELVSLQVYTEEKVGAVETFLHYELNEKYFIITQIMQSDQLGFNGSVQSEEEKIEEVDVNGMTGSLVEASQEDYILVWFSPTHFLSVEGNIVAEEIVKIARSMNMDE